MEEVFIVAVIARHYLCTLNSPRHVSHFTLARGAASRILEALRSNRSVLCVLQADRVPKRVRGDVSSITQLIELALGDDRESGPAPIVLMGSPPIGNLSGAIKMVRGLPGVLAFAAHCRCRAGEPGKPCDGIEVPSAADISTPTECAACLSSEASRTIPRSEIGNIVAS